MEYKLVNHRKTIDKLFREAMSRHGLTKKALEFEKLRHVYTHGYRKSRQTLVVGGDIYCPELWEVLGMPQYSHIPRFQFVAAHSIRMKPGVIDLDDDLNIPFIENHFEEVITRAILPKVKGIHTPKEAVEYALDPGGLSPTGPDDWDEVFEKWTNHYGIPEKFRKWDDLPW